MLGLSLFSGRAAWGRAAAAGGGTGQVYGVSGAAFHLDAQDTASFDLSGSNVDAWRDKIAGGALDYPNVTTPQYDAAGLGGLGEITVTGNGMTTQNAAFLAALNSGQFSMYLVTDLTGMPASGNVMGWGMGTFDQYGALRLYSARIYENTTGQQGDFQASFYPDNAAGTRVIGFRADWTAAPRRLKVENEAGTTETLTDSSFDHAGVLTTVSFGGRYYNGGFVGGASLPIGELLVFDHELSDADHASVMAAIKDRWGLADPHWANVVFLAGATGLPDGSTAWGDEGPVGRNVEVYGDGFNFVEADTDVLHFGDSTIRFAGNDANRAECQESPDFDLGTDDFTAEAFVYYTNTGNERGCTIFNQNGAWSLYHDSVGGTLTFYATISGTNTVFARPWSPTLNTWHHVAVAREAGTLRLFVDGVQLGASFTGVGAIDASTNDLWIGVSDFAAGYRRETQGNMDELRITKGVARYTSNFTVPSAAFPRSGG